MTEKIDIVALVQKHPLNKLSGNYESSIVNKIKDQFTTEEQQIFIANFYCYVNYDNEDDFIVEFDNVWKMLEFSRIDHCKTVLHKNFTENKDYKITKAAPATSGAGKKLGGSGLNKEKILLTVNCFKKLCLKAGTKKADEIHDYYIKLEKIVNQIAKEESAQLRNQLQIKNQENTTIKLQKEQTILSNFHKKPVVYVGFTEENVVKFGYTDNIIERMKEHKNDIKPDFTPEYVYESLYNREIERCIMKHHILSSLRIKKIYGSKPEPQTELLQLSESFTILNLDKIIREIKNRVETGGRDDLLREIFSLEEKISELKLQIENSRNFDIDKLRYENNLLKLQIENMEKESAKKEQNTDEIHPINIQLNSMEDLNIKLHTIKTAVCHNFLIDLVVKNIHERKINLTVHEIFEMYRAYRISNRYQDPIYDETYENTLITKAFNEVNGIKNTYKTVNGEQSRSKLFYIDIVSAWICKNLQIPKRFRNIFREISKDIVFEDTFCKVLNSDMDAEYISSYSFLVYILLKYGTEQIFVIKNTILTEEYLKYTLQFNENKKITMNSLNNILLKIPGIYFKQRINDGNKKLGKGITIYTKNVIKWIEKNLEISESFKNKLILLDTNS